MLRGGGNSLPTMTPFYFCKLSSLTTAFPCFLVFCVTKEQLLFWCNISIPVDLESFIRELTASTHLPVHPPTALFAGVKQWSPSTDPSWTNRVSKLTDFKNYPLEHFCGSLVCGLIWIAPVPVNQTITRDSVV